MKNPIFIEYYSHEGGNCYKINNPWPKYAQDKWVLCKVSKGLEEAKRLARKQMKACLEEALSAEIAE